MPLPDAPPPVDARYAMLGVLGKGAMGEVLVAKDVDLRRKVAYKRMLPRGDGDKLTARELKIGDRVGDRVEILGGVKAGDKVAITDVEKLVDGMKVVTGGPKASE